VGAFAFSKEHAAGFDHDHRHTDAGQIQHFLILPCTRSMAVKNC
jgi:hypothetical protein